MNVYGVIMAGGGGTRFWPLSRQKKPKQLLNLTGEDLMINEAIDRLLYSIEDNNIFIVTNKAQADLMNEVTCGRINSKKILSEPASRNTAACVGYAAMEIIKKYGDGIMVITPSDAYIRDTSAFNRILLKAIDAAKEYDKLVTIGISPTFPATGYGYIKFDKSSDVAAKLVNEFKEKPDEETAKAYLATGEYVWNSGMFIWRASTILKKFKKYVPDIYDDLVRIGESINSKYEKKIIEEVYPSIRKISIDYAIMEPSAANGEVLVVPGEFGWNDVGTWDMMEILHNNDENGNITVGDVVVIDSNNSIFYSNKRIVTAIGVENLIIVETEDAVMVCNKSSVQSVTKIVDILKDLGREELL